jgi:membrane-associated phospholipid phosphatase
MSRLAVWCSVAVAAAGATIVPARLLAAPATGNLGDTTPPPGNASDTAPPPGHSAHTAPPPGSLGDTAPPAGVVWDPRWPRFRAWEYAGTAAFGATTWYLSRDGGPPERPAWKGGVLFDDSVRGWLRAETPEGRARAGKVSDTLWLGGSAYPFVVDLPLVLLVHRQPDVAWQMLMMNLEAYAVAGFLNRVMHFNLGRARPSYDECQQDARYDALCGSTGNNAAFPSGHTLGIATAAGLTCVHHRYLPIYGHRAVDTSACVVMSLATAVTAVTRVMADRHHTTDVLAGATIGFAAGYALPWLLHYRGGSGTGAEKGALRHPVFLPYAGATELGAALVGTL